MNKAAITAPRFARKRTLVHEAGPAAAGLATSAARLPTHPPRPDSEATTTIPQASLAPRLLLLPQSLRAPHPQERRGCREAILWSPRHLLGVSVPASNARAACCVAGCPHGASLPRSSRPRRSPRPRYPRCPGRGSQAARRGRRGPSSAGAETPRSGDPPRASPRRRPARSHERKETFSVPLIAGAHRSPCSLVAAPALARSTPHFSRSSSLVRSPAAGCGSGGFG